MDRKTSIFYKVTNQNENSTTELLCNLFRIKYFRDICLEYFGFEKNFINEIKLENISSQNSTDDSGMPDIVINTDKIKCYIENKILKNTGLQENQKSNYPENLLNFRKTQGKYINYIFLIPKDYTHENEIDKVINEYKDFTRKYYWQDFLSYLYYKELHIESPIINEGLNYFSELVQENKPPDTVLNPREVVIMYNPKTINDVLILMQKIRETIKNSLVLVADKMGKDYSLGGEQKEKWAQGYNFNYKNKLGFFVGITPYLYDEENETFYSVALYRNQLKECIKIDDHEFKHYLDDDWLHIAIDRNLFVEDDKEKILANEIIKILNNVFLKNLKE